MKSSALTLLLTVQPSVLSALARNADALCVERCVLSPVQIPLLVDACREADLIEQLQARLDQSPLTVPGYLWSAGAAPLCH